MKNSIQLVLSSSKIIDFFDPMTLCDKLGLGTRSPDIRLYASQTFIKKVEVPNE